MARVCGDEVARLPVQPGNSDLCFEWSGPIEDAVPHLRSAGVAVEAGPVERSGARGSGRSVYFCDPDGSLIESSPTPPDHLRGASAVPAGSSGSRSAGGRPASTRRWCWASCGRTASRSRPGPASSSFVRWLERLPLVSPVVRCRKTKSASWTEDSTVRIASRPGSWMSRSSVSSSLRSGIAILERQAPGRPERAHEQRWSKRPVAMIATPTRTSPNCLAATTQTGRRPAAGSEPKMIRWRVLSTPPVAKLDSISRAKEAAKALTGRSREKPARLRSRRGAAKHQRRTEDDRRRCPPLLWVGTR